MTIKWKQPNQSKQYFKTDIVNPKNGVYLEVYEMVGYWYWGTSSKERIHFTSNPCDSKYEAMQEAEGSAHLA